MLPKGVVVIGIQDAAQHFNVPYDTARTVAHRVGVCHRVGQMSVILVQDLPLVAAGLRTLGWEIPFDVDAQQQESLVDG
jgi:hypothetical protein